jgi:hypothetical protein
MRVLIVVALLALTVANVLPGDGIEGCTGHESPFLLN